MERESSAAEELPPAAQQLGQILGHHGVRGHDLLQVLDGVVVRVQFQNPGGGEAEFRVHPLHVLLHFIFEIHYFATYANYTQKCI